MTIAAVIIGLQEYWPLNTDGLTIERIRNETLVANFVYPSKKTNLPVIVFLGGSGGGLTHEDELKALALHGYAVLSLAYFNTGKLPAKLENIPLEYFKDAFDWLSTQKQIDSDRLTLMGISRGAELALLLASKYDQVSGVIAYAPACIVLPNATEIEGDSLKPSWTYMGRAVPFAPVPRFNETAEKSINYRTYIDPVIAGTDSKSEYLIEVERINGPILLLAGDQDLVWPASDMATMIDHRLKAHGFNHEVHNHIFNGGGHDLFMFKDRYPIVSSLLFKSFSLSIRGAKYKFNLGGTPIGVIRSKRKSRALALQFLKDLKGHP